MNSTTLQVAEVSTPLVSVSRILDKGNAVIFSRSGSYILNEASGRMIPIVEERGTFGFLESDFVREGCRADKPVDLREAADPEVALHGGGGRARAGAASWTG